MSFVAPDFEKKGYTCPHCGAFSQQEHHMKDWDLHTHHPNAENNPVRTSKCMFCNKWHLWRGSIIVWPDVSQAPPPNQDMPAEVLDLYKEASSISLKSPRASAALLRLGIQHLCKHLGAKGKDINDDVAFLVKKGLPSRVQKSLDIVRVVGNHAVHPGQIDFDNPETAASLFGLLNEITEQMVSSPKRIELLYESLPNAAKEAIEKRDAAR